MLLYGPACLPGAIHVNSPYEVPNVYVDAYCVYTNNPYCGAMRGFGVPQVDLPMKLRWICWLKSWGFPGNQDKNFLRWLSYLYVSGVETERWY